MTIVMNEIEWVEDALRERSLGKKPTETLYRVAKYYTSKGYKKSEIRKIMEAFIIRCDPMASLPKWSDAIDRSIAYAGKHKIIHIEKIVVTKPEMDAIARLDSIQSKRLAFTLLCIAKYYDAINPNADHWVGLQDSEIMRMANVNTSVARQSFMYRAMNDAGMIEFSRRVDNTSVRVAFMEEGEAAVEITDMRNLGYQYMMAVGRGGFIVCEECGAIVPGQKAPIGRPQKYCKECAAKVKVRSTVAARVSAREMQTNQNFSC